MIIDSLRESKNIVKVSPVKYASPKFLEQNQSYSFLESDFYWHITGDVIISYSIGTMKIGSTFVVGGVASSNTATIVVNFDQPLSFKSLDFDYTNDTAPLVNVYYTLDGTVWEFFNYYTYTISNFQLLLNDVDKEVLSKFENMLIKTTMIDGVRYYSIQDAVVANYEYIILKSYLDSAILNGDEQYIKPTLVFEDEDGYLYNDFYIRGIKIVFSNLEIGVIPFSMNALSILSEAEVEVPNTYISMFKDNLFRPSYFKEFDFIPSIAKTFMEMLESGETISEQQKQIQYPEPDIVFEKVYMYYGISNISNPLSIDLQHLMSTTQKISSFTVDATNGGFIYFVCPANMGSIRFIINQEVTFEQASINIGMVDYIVYKSQYEQRGSDIEINLIWS